MKIILRGPIPGKKNLLRRSRNGGLFRDKNVSAQIELLRLQAMAQWIRKIPMDKPALAIHFTCLDQRADLDNKATTVLDCLVGAGVLVNDNLKHLPGPITISGEVGEEEMCIVVLGDNNGK